jgi:FixJ family two-component response regulator
MEKIPLLIVTSRQSDIEELAELLRDTSWQVERVLLPAAPDALKTADVPIMLFDRDAAGPDWRARMKRLVTSRRNACVVLLSSVTDQYLWEEVVHHGGFDLLTRPFRKEQVLSTLVFAFAHCRAPWPKALS